MWAGVGGGGGGGGGWGDAAPQDVWPGRREGWGRWRGLGGCSSTGRMAWWGRGGGVCDQSQQMHNWCGPHALRCIFSSPVRSAMQTCWTLIGALTRDSSRRRQRILWQGARCVKKCASLPSSPHFWPRISYPESSSSTPSPPYFQTPLPSHASYLGSSPSILSRATSRLSSPATATALSVCSLVGRLCARLHRCGGREGRRETGRYTVLCMGGDDIVSSLSF